MTYAPEDRPAEQHKEHVVVCRLGRIDYVPAWELQKKLQAHLVSAKRSSPPERIDHVMLMVEHPHVYTLGKSGDRSHLLATEEALAAQGASFQAIDRGGDITYHGPGQLVVYPILDLDRFFTDIHRYLRELEEAVIRTCRDYGLRPERIPGRTGVWIPPTDIAEPARKICAMGIRCSRWVTMHGIGFNLNTELDRYEQIIPCGIQDGDVTSLSRETGSGVDEEAVQRLWLSHFCDLFDATSTLLDGDTAYAFLESYLGEALLSLR